MLIENYLNTQYQHPGYPGGVPCTRWSPHSQIIVGGSILSLADGEHLANDFGVTAIISVESERGDVGRLPANVPAGHWPWPDIGAAPPLDLVRAVVAFARGARDAKFYVHCQQGGSRSPAMAYALMRSWGLAADAALAAIRVDKPEYGDHQYHKTYLAAVEEALR